MGIKFALENVLHTCINVHVFPSMRVESSLQPMPISL